MLGWMQGSNICKKSSRIYRGDCEHITVMGNASMSLVLCGNLVISPACYKHAHGPSDCADMQWSKQTRQRMIRDRLLLSIDGASAASGTTCVHRAAAEAHFIRWMIPYLRRYKGTASTAVQYLRYLIAWWRQDASTAEPDQAGKQSAALAPKRKQAKQPVRQASRQARTDHAQQSTAGWPSRIAISLAPVSSVINTDRPARPHCIFSLVVHPRVVLRAQRLSNIPSHHCRPKFLSSSHHHA